MNKPQQTWDPVWASDWATSTNPNRPTGPDYCANGGHSASDHPTEICPGVACYFRVNPITAWQHALNEASAAIDALTDEQRHHALIWFHSSNPDAFADAIRYVTSER